MLQEFGMSECTLVSTPMSTKSSKVVTTAFNKREMSYAKLIGSLLYASNFIRLDIIASVHHDVNYLSRYMSHRGVEHWLQAKQQEFKIVLTFGCSFVLIFKIVSTSSDAPPVFLTRCYI